MTKYEFNKLFYKRQGAIIALAKVRRAQEIMRAFQRVSNNPKKNV